MTAKLEQDSSLQNSSISDIGIGFKTGFFLAANQIDSLLRHLAAVSC